MGSWDTQMTSGTVDSAAQVLNMRCSKGTSYTLTVDGGKSVGTGAYAGFRAMKGATAGNTDVLAYNLCKSVSPCVPWANPTSTTVVSASSAPFTQNFYVSIPAPQDVNNDTYNDAVTISLNF
jgi:spore coat protein U-like protein